MKKAVHITDSTIMSCLIDLAVRKNYLEFFDKANYGLEYYYGVFKKNSVSV